MRATRVIFLGGNGHCAARLDPARAALARRPRDGAPPVELVEIAYPGFEGRPRAAGLGAFLDAISAGLGAASRAAPGAVVYATGIGGLLALCLRARGEHASVPLLLQAPVLWGLERRWMPRLLQGFPPAQRALHCLFASALFQRRFARRYFVAPPPGDVIRAFFDGYARCAALPDLFAWLTPRLLRDLEAALTARREQALRAISVWWGALDRVVSLDELRWTEEALGVRWPVETFPSWGHYPMIDDPEGWVSALSRIDRTGQG